MEEEPYNSHTARNVTAGAGAGAADDRTLQDRHTSLDDAGRRTSPQHDRNVDFGADPNVSGGTQRAFPLTSSGPEGLSSETNKNSNTDWKAREGFAAGAAAGIGSGAYGFSQKHESVDRQATHSPVTQPAQQYTSNRSQTSADSHGLLQRHHEEQPHQHTLQKSPSPDARASHSRSSSRSEKQRHGLLGMISRKDENASSHPKIAEDEKGHRVLAKEPPADIAPAVIAARQASVRHQAQSPDRGHQHDAFIKPGSESRRDEMATNRDLSRNTNSSSQSRSADFDRSAGGGSGASGPLHGVEEASAAQHTHSQPTSTVATEHLPPHFSNTHNTVTGDKLPYNTLASGTPSGVALGSQDQQPQTHSPQLHGNPNMIQASAQGTSDRLSESHVGRDVAAGAGVGAAAVAGSRAIRASDQDRDVSYHTRTDGGLPATQPATTTNDYRSGNRSGYHDGNQVDSGDNSATERDGRHGPHSSRVANAVDPRVDSDRDGSRTLKVFRSHPAEPTKTESASGEALNNQDRDRSITGPSTSDDHEVRNPALGAGAGAAAYAGSRAIHDRQATDSHNTGSSFGDPNFTRPAQAAGQPALRTSGGSASRQDTGIHEAASSAARYADGYDHLASGTPSGIATTSTSSPIQQHPSSVSSSQAQHPNPRDNKTSDIAAGVGAGAAVYAGSRALEDRRHPFSTPTDSSTTRQTPPGLAGEDASLYTAGATTNRTLSNPHTSTAGGSDGYDHLASGTPSGVVHTKTADQDDAEYHGTKAAPFSREAHGAEGTTSGTSRRAYADQHRAPADSSGVGAGVIAGAAAAQYTSKSELHDGRHSAPTAQPTSQGSRTTEPPLYNILPSGTPSGVNIEHIRRSKELSRE